MNTDKSKRRKEIFAGLGLGALIGIIIGLSIAQVTGIILGALTSLLAAFFGLREKKSEDSENHLIVGTFGIACIAFIFIGLYVRTHNLISPSLQSQKEEYKNIGFSEEEIKKIFLIKEFGVVPSGYTFSKDAKEVGSSTVLMAGNETAPSLCLEIAENASLKEMQEAFVNSGKIYQETQERLSQTIPDTTQLKQTLLILKTAICQKQ